MIEVPADNQVSGRIPHPKNISNVRDILSEELCCAVCLCVCVGDEGVAAGLVGMMMRWITPLAIIPTVTLIGISLFDVCADKVSSHWSISIV